jgi:hypothetical protein
MATNIVEVQTLRGIKLLGGDFNVHIVVLLNTIDTSDLCELLQAPKLVRIEQLGTVAKRQNCDASVNGWGRELLNLCCDIKLLILNGRTLIDESGEFICLANGGHNNVDYIIGSLVVWQVATHFEVIIDDTRYYTIGGDSDHRLLCLLSNINCNFVEPQHTIETKKFLPRFNMINQTLKSISLP